jgi:AraC-like DNA-binding protein
MMLLPIFLMTVANFFPSQKELLLGGLLEKYTFLPFPNYSTRTGILLEMTVFLFGLTYKTRKERLENERIRQRNIELENTRLEQEEQLSAQRAKRHEERNQWTDLLLHAEAEKQALLEKLAKNGSHPPENGQAAPHPFFVKLEKTIEANYADPKFGIEPLAEALNVSRATLFRQLKELGANAPAEIIRDFRLQKAADLLTARPELNVAQVADACGFEDSGHFIKLFSKKYGKTPLQWRKNNLS